MSQSNPQWLSNMSDSLAQWPEIRLVHTFRQAVHLPKLAVALLLVLLLGLAGRMLDAVTGPRVPGYDAIATYSKLSPQAYQAWKAGVDPKVIKPVGVFDASCQFAGGSLWRLGGAAMNLRLGLGEVYSASDYDRQTVIGSLRDLLLVLPRFLATQHPWITAVYGLYALVIWAMVGGTLARMAAVHAVRNERISPVEAFRFVARRPLGFLFCLPLPVLVVAMIAFVLVVGGFVFFNLPLLEMVGSLLFGGALALGIAAAGVSLISAAAAPMMFPVLAVEASDPFDAVSRAVNYVLGRPWRWAACNLVILVYGAITTTLVATIVLLAVWMTHAMVDAGVVAGSGTAGVSRFDAVFPSAEAGVLSSPAGDGSLGVSMATAGQLIRFWVGLFEALIAAYLVSYFMVANTHLYLLLRRSADGTALDEMAVVDVPTPPAAPPVPVPPPTAAPDEVEVPASQAGT